MKRFTDIYEKKVDIVQRRKAAQRMSKLAKSPAFQRKKARAQLKIRDMGKLSVLAKKKVHQEFRDKFYPDYKDLSPAQRVQADQKINQKFGAKIAKKAAKLAKKLKAGEADRVAAAKAAYKE